MPINDNTPRPQEFAAVDLGSNSFHMVIAREVDGAMQIIGRLKQRVHLADGLDARNMLSEEAMERGLNCLSLFAERLQGFSPSSVCIVGTHTLRQALNAPEFLKRAEKVIPYPIEIISRAHGRRTKTGKSGLAIPYSGLERGAGRIGFD